MCAKLLSVTNESCRLKKIEYDKWIKEDSIRNNESNKEIVVNRQFVDKDRRGRNKLVGNSTKSAKTAGSTRSFDIVVAKPDGTRRVVLDERLWRKSAGISPWGLH